MPLKKFYIPFWLILFAIFGIIWGVKALKTIKREPNRLKGKDVTIIGIVLNSLYFVGLAFLFYLIATSDG